MRVYEYTAVDREANRRRGRIEAEDQADFMRRLAAEGLYCESFRVKEVREHIPRAAYRMKNDDLMMFCSQLSIMLRSGVQLPSAMDILSERSQKPDQKALFMRINEYLHTGGMFSDALSREGRAFPAMMVNMVRAAESSGAMDEVMGRLALYFEREKERNAKIKSASTYPIILLFLTVGIVIAIFTFVMPRLLTLMNGQEPTGGMKLLADMTNLITQRWYVLLLIAGAVVLLFAVLRSIPTAHEALDHLKLRFPILGKLRRSIYVTRFAEAFATLYRAGVRANDALSMASATIVNTYYNRKCEEARAEVDVGAPLSKALERTGLFDPMFCSMVKVGEESGNMEEVLNKIAEYYDKEGQIAINRAVDMLQPIFIICIAIFVGFVVITIMTSLYSMIGNVGTGY